MTPDFLPLDDPGRLGLLRELRVTEAGELTAFDAIARLAALQLACPFSLVGLVDDTQLKTLAQHGLGFGAWLPRELALCSHTVLAADVLEVRDTLADPRFETHPLVRGEARPPLPGHLPALHFYAGAPIRVEGRAIGAVSVFDTQPRELTAPQRQALQDLAALASELMSARLKERRAKLHAARVRTASLSSSDWLWETDADGRLTWLTDSIEVHTGRPARSHLGMTLAELRRPPDPADDGAPGPEDAFALPRHDAFADLLGWQETPLGTIATSLSGVPVFDGQGVYRGHRGAGSNITLQLQAQKAARQTEEMLSDALESLVAGLMITDASDKVLRSNAVWRNRCIDKAADKTGQHWPTVLREMIADGDYPDALGDEDRFFEWRLTLGTADGTLHEVRWRDRWMMVSAKRLANGHVVHLSIDVTELKRAQLLLAEQQAQLSDSEERLSAVLQAVPDLWFVLDADGRYLECSDDDHPLIDRNWQALRHQPFSVAGNPEAQQAAVAAVREALVSGEVQRHEYLLPVGPDGDARSVEARVSPMLGDRVLYVLRDLTELRSLERDLTILKRAVEADAALPLCFTDATHPGMPIVYVNRAFETQTGYRREELLGRNCRILQGHLTHQPAIALIREAIANQRECTATLDNVRKDGTVFSNALHVAPVYDPSGVLTHYLGVMHDVTEQSRAADKLRLSEVLYRSVALAISDGLLVVTPTLSVIAANPAACVTLGISQESLVGAAGAWPFQFLDDRLQPLASHLLPVQHVIGTGEPLVNQVHPLRRADGTLRWVELNAQPLQLRPESSTFSVVLTFRDITRQRLAEQALATAEERWKFALEGSGDGVWDWDAQSNKVFYSPRWKSMMGYAEHEIGDSVEEWTSRIHPDHQPQMMSELRRHLRGETPLYQSEHRVRHREGHDLWILDRGKVVSRNADGRPLRVVGTQSDITSGKRAEQALRDKQAAELANEAKTQFLSRMSHEMRTPLNAVIGFAQLMRMEAGGGDTSQAEGYAEHILNAGQHLLALINDVLDLQKVEEGGLSLDMRPVDLAETVMRTLELLQPAAKERQVWFETDMSPGRWWVKADANRLRQVVLNIASNAVKYNHPGGTVKLRVEQRPHRRLRLCIEDTGTGMTARQMDRLFQPFERLGKETSSIEGTGLGLIIARSLTQAIGGSLDIRSVPGRGTQVDIELPRDDAPDSDQPPSSDSPESTDNVTSHSAPLRMLYVEDNRINAILFEGALRMHNSSVELRVAEDGEEALFIAESWVPEVLVLDAHLPGMSGFDVLRQLRAMPGLSTAPAYMCSADAMPEDVQRAYEAGFIGYWTKPIDIATVLSDIDALGMRLRNQAAA
jgi:PAS domain S-box-containing protein